MSNTHTIESDRALLEWAAKAAGYKTDHPLNALRLTLDPPVAALCIEGLSTGWNPLDDDGDCARLEAALRITVRWFLDGRVIAEGRDGGTGNELFANHGGDRNAARRRASVYAAVDRLIEELEG